MSAENKSCSTEIACQTSGCCWTKCAVYGFAIVGTLLIAGALVAAMIHYTKPAPLGEDRVALRKKSLAEIREANAEALTTYGWVDQNKGLVRLPVAQAMAQAVTAWKNPAAARADLLARVAKAAAPAPVKPSAFE
ncbi:MAG: hypothetical protein RLZZ350_1910 [Verrucomicrobiota bacterium]|jgi:hypothetical protein